MDNAATNNKTLFILIPTLHLAGPQIQLTNLAIELKRRGYTVIVILTYKVGPLVGLLKSRGVQIFGLDRQGKNSFFRSLKSLLKLVDLYRPYAIYSFFGPSHLLNGCMKLLFPKIKAIWAIRATKMCQNGPMILNRTLIIIARRLYDNVIANSNAGIKDALDSGFNKNKIWLCNNGIDCEKYYYSKELRDATRKELSIDKDTKLIGIVGRIHPMKNHRQFFKIAKKLKQIDSNIRFLVIGDGQPAYVNALKKEATQMKLDNDVIWTGEIEDIQRYYNAIDLLCSTSLYGEGFPNVIGEAMACGIPCVSFGAGDSKRIIDKYGETVSEGNVDSFVESVQRQLQYKKYSPIEIQSYITKNFSIKKMADTTEKIIFNCRE